MTSELIEKLNSLTSAVIEHRRVADAEKLSTFNELENATRKFYNELWERYGKLLSNTQKIYNCCDQYIVHTEHGDLTMGLAATGFFSSLAGWCAYSFGHFGLYYRNNKKDLLRLRDFLNNVDWGEFDKQITEQAVKLFGKYEEETLKEELWL